MRLYAIILAVVGLTLIPVLVLDDEIDAYFAGEEGLRRLRQFGGWAWLAGIGLIVADLVLPVPSTAVIAGLGMLYGPWLGGLIGGAGSTLAGLVGYAGGRWVGRPALKLFVGPADLGRLGRFFARHGLWAVAVSRWMPLLPEALCCLGGAARMRVGPFLAALLCGSLAMGFVFASLGEQYLDRPAAGLILSALIPLAVWPPVHYFLRRRPVIEPDPAADPVVVPGLGGAGLPAGVPAAPAGRPAPPSPDTAGPGAESGLQEGVAAVSSGGALPSPAPPDGLLRAADRPQPTPTPTRSPPERGSAEPADPF